jgi:hypothetical protein
MDRRSFLARTGSLAGMVAVGKLILPQAYVEPGVDVGQAMEPPKVFVPEKPALVAATSIERPFFEGTLSDWSLATDTGYDRVDVTSHDTPGATYVRHFISMDEPVWKLQGTIKNPMFVRPPMLSPGDRWLYGLPRKVRIHMTFVEE